MSKSKLQQFVESFPWVKNETTPFSKITKELKDCKVALISTGGIYVAGDTPFAINNREDVDETYREIPLGTSGSELKIAHEHFNKDYAKEDINVIFPVKPLQMLAEKGVIGEVASSNFSITGYIPKPNELFKTSKQIAEKLKSMTVDVALVVPV